MISFKPLKIKSKLKSPKQHTSSRVKTPKMEIEDWKENLDILIFKIRMDFQARKEPMPLGTLDLCKKIFESKDRRESYKKYNELLELCKLKN